MLQNKIDSERSKGSLGFTAMVIFFSGINFLSRYSRKCPVEVLEQRATLI